MQREPASLRQWLRRAATLLAAAGIDSGRLDAEVIAASALGLDRSRMLADGYKVDDAARSRLEMMLSRRLAREPLAYITGVKEFYSLEFEVTAEVLIPRPETELLVENALDFMDRRQRPRALDLGTGCGAIAIAMAANNPDLTVVATDISVGALECARRNARRLGCESRIEFRYGDMWQALSRDDRQFDLIISNPPYIPRRDLAWLMPEVERYEPRLALMAGEDGLLFYRRISEKLKVYLRRGGEVMVEVGTGQAGAVATILTEAGCSPAVAVRDLAGQERLVRASLSDSSTGALIDG